MFCYEFWKKLESKLKRKTLIYIYLKYFHRVRDIGLLNLNVIHRDRDIGLLSFKLKMFRDYLINYCLY